MLIFSSKTITAPVKVGFINRSPPLADHLVRLFLQLIAGRNNTRLERSARKQLEPDFLAVAIEN